jgi:hypothetical protein
MQENFIAIILFVTFGLSSCATNRSELDSKVIKEIGTATSSFFKRYNVFEANASALARATQLIQYHKHWKSFETALQQALAKAYVDGYPSLNIDFSWPESNTPTADEKRFSEQLAQLFNSSKELEKERKYLLKQWESVKIVFITYLDTMSVDRYSSTKYEIWHQRKRQVDSTLNGYGLDDLGLFIRFQYRR